MAVAEPRPNRFFDVAQDRRLAEIYAPCFTLILQLRASHDFGDLETLRRRIKDLLDHSEREALRLGISREDIPEARFALVAFIDETILSSRWSQKAQWEAKPLQLEFSDRYDAGEEFFVRLDRLLAQPAADVLEVFYLCMALGFKGRYELYEQERLLILIEETFAALSRTPRMGVGELSPHGKPRGQVATEVRDKLPVWVFAVFAVGLALLIYIGMSLSMNSKAGHTASIIDQVPRPAATR